MRATCFAALLALSVAASPSWPADAIGLRATPSSLPSEAVSKAITGRVAIIDGRTLWFPRSAEKVRLAGIDVCELPQWAFDPTRYGKNTVLKPMPCGPLAKAWLKRVVGDDLVTCWATAFNSDGAYVAACSTRGRDLAVEMLRVGWALVTSPALPGYDAWQRHAMTARYGMWATYVLDMDEWRGRAVDRTLQRQPVADFNLLAERAREISPPFADARKRPRRSDR
ncbi:thermonuclease family protein [Mesorhizobium sp. M1A.F.Ca.ET.072.01.1.1]|uniref:thermonuclease family protein n=1 Tax=Mesorhizobium sp. M1A.F.Ca.ET.072.01.1.1 TaxID=2496753 RepID=UPI000FD30730|nr:thermonuclease family protein [Mesorhizobium sp. M1A.F.Ca.ET.072.01.1.1]RUW49846.1 thermonuclease family protein [Mesorhizobium sp. M1A.F.Ca.ET.072.01.1.1]TIV04243.1 MAG: thermonuclease family protein [Mesorhizobium sp.]